MCAATDPAVAVVAWGARRVVRSPVPPGSMPSDGGAGDAYATFALQASRS